MEIRPTGEPLDIGIALRGVLQELEERVDKSEIQPITIRSESERQRVAEDLIEDRREIAFVETSLNKFGEIAFAVHRTITGERNRYSAYAKARAEIRDAAITEHAKEQKRIEDAENARLREVGRQEEEARKKAEVEELNRRAKQEQRPDLAQRAKDVAAAPIREIAIGSRGGGALKQRTRGGEGGSVGLRPGYVVEIIDPDALILAAARPHIYRELIGELDAIAKTLKKKKKTLAEKSVEAGFLSAIAVIRDMLSKAPQIPLTVLEPSEARIKENAKATDGRINWPGCAISKDYKTQVRK